MPKPSSEQSHAIGYASWDSASRKASCCGNTGGFGARGARGFVGFGGAARGFFGGGFGGATRGGSPRFCRRSASAAVTTSV